MPLTRLAPNQAQMPLSAHRDASGRLVVGGCDVTELARRFGTPLYVLDEATVRAACRAYTSALARHYPGPGRVLYASKALCTQAVMALVASEGLDFDVVSAGELHTALTAGVPAARCVMQGNNKPEAELRMGLEAGVGRINVDNLDELRLLARLVDELDVTARVLLRVAPGVETRTHSFIQTGQRDSKFGLDLTSGQLEAALDLISQHPKLLWMGLQAHLGSQLSSLDAYEASAALMVDLLADIRDRRGWCAAELDLGGGLAICYTDADEPPTIESAVKLQAESVAQACQRRGYPLPTLVLEPGRSIVGSAGLTLYTVGGRKEVPGVRTFLAVDGGMADNMRPITYGARYTFALADREAGSLERVTIAGRYCESGDVLARDVELPAPTAGDTLVVFATGAYNYVLASNYNRIGRPAMVLVADGAADVIVERESLDDVVRLDRLPSRLR